MDLHLAGKRAFVSGSTQGIGYAIARALAGEGVSVVINGRDASRVEQAVRALRAEAAEAAEAARTAGVTDATGAAEVAEIGGIAADFADPAQVERLVATLGEVDILVNNVGLFGVTPFGDIRDDDWQRYFDVNVMSGVRLSRALLPGMLTRGWGRVLFIGSESGVNVPADMVHYGATKAAMLAVGNGLAKLTRGTAVTVNSILGGPTYSDGVAGAVDGLAETQGLPAADLKAAIIGGNSTTLLERFIEPTEIANLAVYLASPVSSATNGAAVRADGGVLTSTL
ncbi:SDR family NAD(P)-dependent oxidoreductase [Herbiconiux daphne]|uniref:SDR family oxidoreductase n=1 Tax=Herbiconiux daphne TaxID=2970914 RepID=A0ABT2GXC0_9MICO|nr:SDR family oxidoreductase [Herbiconiux daphne]MCS5732526.1 SDR family oxidoreductase [Herbiconiux daphne]